MWQQTIVTKPQGADIITPSSTNINLGVAAKPLAGIKVADFSRLLPGAYCTWLLAALGAEVVKIEQPGVGDYQRNFGLQVGDRGAALFQLVNQGKRSLGLDLKHPMSVAVLKELLGTCDIVVESFRPGVAVRLGLDFNALLKERPSLVCISISGFGYHSPLQQVAAHDINYLAFSGFLNGQLQQGLGIPEIPLVDLIGGGLMPALSAVSLVLRAKLTGLGGLVDASLADAIPLLPNATLASALLGRPLAAPEDTEFSGSAPYYTVYPLKDGHAAVGAVEEKFRMQLAARLQLHQREQVRTDGNREDLKQEIANKFRSMTRRDVDILFENTDTCVTVVNTYSDMLASKQALAREYTAPPSAPGSMPRLGSPFFHDGRREFCDGVAPLLGEHSSQILIEHGFSASDVTALAKAGALQIRKPANSGASHD